jgi:hypothetical protein
MGHPRLFRSIARFDPVMGNAEYGWRHPHLAGGRAYTVQSTMYFCLAWRGGGAAAAAARRRQRGGGGRAVVAHSATAVAAWRWRIGGGSLVVAWRRQRRRPCGGGAKGDGGGSAVASEVAPRHLLPYKYITRDSFIVKSSFWYEKWIRNTFLCPLFKLHRDKI